MPAYFSIHARLHELKARLFQIGLLCAFIHFHTNHSQDNSGVAFRIFIRSQ